MADNRFNQVPAFVASGGYQIGQQNLAMNGAPGMSPYLPGGISASPMMQQQQMMMASGMRYPMQTVRMGIPSTPPAPYSIHAPSSGVASFPARPRASLHKSKEGQLSDKERFFEEQRQKLKLFGKPGTVKVDADKLIGSMFSPDVKTPQAKVKSKHFHKLHQDDDDGFGDFLQGPSTPSNVHQTDSQHVLSQQTPSVMTSPEPKLEHPSEKKDLKSIMMECSDLSAPKKAKGFQKLTLNEVQRSGHHKVSLSSFHESDHARSWKHNTQDLDGLFQLPVTPKQVATPTTTALSPDSQQHSYTPHQVMAAGQTPTNMAVFPPGSQILVTPPAYSDVVAGHPVAGVAHTPGITSVAVNHPGSGDIHHGGQRQVNLPDWCLHGDNQVPPVYKQVLEASLIDGKISTEHLYRILLLSGLPREKLAQIWSLCNTTTPGQLTSNELWMVLALVALTQCSDHFHTLEGLSSVHELRCTSKDTKNNYNTHSLDILARCPVAPVPAFAQIQDTAAPATLPTRPQQRQDHGSNHQSSVSVSMTPPAAPLASSSSTTCHQQQQLHTAPLQQQLQQHQLHTAHPHQQQQLHTVDPHPQQQLHTPHPHQQPLHTVHHPKLLAHKAPLQSHTAAATRKDVLPPDDDDFADFQTAAAARSAASVTVGTDEDYGEFIGGGGVGSTGASLSYPVSNHMGNGSVVMGAASFHPVQLQHQQQQQQVLKQPQSHQQQQPLEAQQQPASLSLASLPVDDKYGTNVRSFFCSSDSSTGQTSPSFEDDDFTDGRDSLSQVSTSEQSENEDIRNFENYVVEYNQQKEKPGASPLHCPFPAFQQQQEVLFGAKKLETFSFTPGVGQVSDAKNSGQDGRMSRLEIGAGSQKRMHAGFNPTGGVTPSAFKVASLPTSRMSKGKDGGEFADFKMASVNSPAATQVLTSGDMSLIGDEDKYSALRVLSLDTDVTPTSLFEGQGHTQESSPPESDNGREAAQIASLAPDDDEWADFSSAAGEASSTPASSGVNVHQSRLSGSPLVSDDHQATSTPRSSLGLGLSMLGNHLPASDVNQQNISSLDNVGGDWLVTDGDRTAGGRQPDSPNDNTVNKVNLPGSAVTAGLYKLSSVASSVRVDLDNTLTVDDDWGQYSKNSFSSDTSFSTFSPSIRSEGKNSVTEFSNTGGKSVTSDDDWCDFSGADSGDISAKINASVTGTDETENGDSKGKFVTIKKQNLGTNEIMGLFKVRDDPATLSSYQLPQQQHHHHHHHHHTKMTTSQSHSSLRTSSSSHGNRRSSDFDDELGPPPMDFGHDDDYDDLAFSRGYDLDDFMHRAPPATTYSPYGASHSSPVYSRAGAAHKLKENKEDSGSVHSLDLPSVRPAHPSGSDSQSVSSADLVSGEMTIAGAGVVSPESKSVDSLDFKSDSGDVDSSDGGNHEGVPASDSASSKPHQPIQPHHPIQPQELLDSMPDFADRYNIEREAQGSDRYGYEWERCLCNCFKVISEANSLFNLIDSSSVCNEVLKSSQGSSYITCVIEIYRVVCRVLTSMRVTAISTTELEQTLKNINLAWNNLTAFLVGTSLLPDEASLTFSSCVLKSDMERAQQMACGLCLLSVDARPLTSALSASPQLPDVNTSKLTYAGRQYHATCANFWVNCVDQTLPSLTLPDLL